MCEVAWPLWLGRVERCYILALGESVRGPHAWGNELHPRFPLGKAQDQFSLFLPVAVNTGLLHHCSCIHALCGLWGLFFPLYCPDPTLCLFWVWRQGFGVCVHVQCQASLNLQREEVGTMSVRDCWNGNRQYAAACLSVALILA